MIRRHNTLVFLTGLVALSAIGFQTVASEAVDKPSGHNALGLAQTPLQAGAIAAPEGFVGVRWQANVSGSLKGFDIDRHVRMVEERKMRDWWWIGEQPGKWLEASVLSSAIARDPAFAAKAKEILARLVNAQAVNGYLGISDPSVLTAAKPLRGMDPYEQYFMLHGLLTAWEVLGDPTALEAAKKLGSYYVDHIGPGKAEFWPSTLRPPENRNTIIVGQYTWVPPGTRKAAQAETDMFGRSEIAGHGAHYGWEGTLMIDPILRLYQATGDKRYLDWSAWVVSRIDTWSGWDSFSRLDDVASGKIGMHQLQPYVHSHTFQMNFLGFLRLYQITGDPSCLRKVEGAWRDIVSRQLYITGGVSVGEHYEPGYNRPVEGGVVETCANMSWMEMNQYLLELTGDPKYAEVMERLLINHVFAAQAVDGDCYRYHTPPNGMKPEGFFHGPDCCTASGHRLTAKVPTFIYAQAKDTAIVNQYVPSSAAIDLGGGRKVTLKQETRYPEEETVSVHVDPATAGKFTLRLRIPAWCEQPAATLNGIVVGGVKSGTYLDITRVWQAGDRVKLTFPMTARWVEHDHLEANQARWALIRGPVVYAVDNLWWDVKDVASPRKVDQALALAAGQRGRIKPVPAPAGLLGPAYRAELTAGDGTVVEPLLVPFANVGVWYKDPAKKPERNSATYSYAVWLYAAETSAFKQMAEEQKVMSEALRNAIDLVRIGDAASEKAHQLQGESGAGGFNGRTYRHGKAFSYELKVATEAPSDLVVTYWGGDVNREFDVLANEQVLATQKLSNNKPGQFFEVRYRIPFELVKGKTTALGQKADTVRIGFRGHSGTAGGVFGVRAEPGAVRDGEGDVLFKARPFGLEQVRLLDGPFKEAQERDRRCLHDVDAERLLHAFRITAGLATTAKPYGGWEDPGCELRGHSAGHFLSACALMFAATGDEPLKAKADYMVAELAKCQVAMPGKGYNGGFLSAYPEDFFDRVDACKPVWAPYYTLHKIMAGLLDVYQLCGNKQALDVVSRMADWVEFRCARLSEDQMQKMLNMEYGGMGEVLANLHAVTGRKEQLALAHRFDKRQFVDPLAEGRDNLRGLHANTHIPQAIAAAREYELTGVPRYRNISTFFWDQVAGKRSFATGGTGNNEHWRTEPGRLSTELSVESQESCCIYNMLKLAEHLFQWQPDAALGDYYERALINGILCTQHPDNGMTMYYVSMKPGHFKVFCTPENSFWCCTGTGWENHARYGAAIYFRDDTGLWVNQFIASELNWKEKGLTVKQETGFPDAERAALSVTAQKPVKMAMRVRVPYWAQGASMTVNGKAEGTALKPGTFATIDRTWETGDRVEIKLPMRLHLAPMPDDKDLIAVMYGPMVLAGRLGTEKFTKSIQFQGDQRGQNGAPAIEVPLLIGAGDDVDRWVKPVGGQALTFRTEGVGKPADITLVPLHKLFDERYSIYWRRQGVPAYEKMTSEAKQP